MFKRSIETVLLKWKNETPSVPLILRGARQVGKSSIVKKFAREHFETFVEINFEYQPRFKACFDDLNPRTIVNRLSLTSGQDIIPGKTLLFLDEIQECPPALLALRYFKEKMPDLHVIAAGSLLEFLFHQEDFRMPVGRVAFAFMYPLSFREFLDVTGRSQWAKYLSEVHLQDGVDPAMHEPLLESVKTFFITGGMPAVVEEYLKSQNLKTCQEVQTRLIQTYRADFGKYARKADVHLIERIFMAAPRMIGRKVQFSGLSSEHRAYEVRRALELLEDAGVLRMIHAASAGYPLGALVSEKKMKLSFLDIGLVQNICGLSAEIVTKEDLTQINAGALAEQFVAQEFLSAASALQARDLFFWSRDKRGSSAEVDFLEQAGSRIYPVEVKSGKAGRLKSLQIFLDENHLSVGVQMSQKPLSFEGKILSVPFYLAGECHRLIRQME